MKGSMMSYRKTTIAALAGVLALTACSSNEPERDAYDNEASETSEPVETPSPTDLPPAEAPPPVTENSTAAIEAPPAPEIAPDAQVLDDADATGMTARVSRDEEPAADAPTTTTPANDGAAQ